MTECHTSTVYCWYNMVRYNTLLPVPGSAIAMHAHDFLWLRAHGWLLRLWRWTSNPWGRMSLWPASRGIDIEVSERLRDFVLGIQKKVTEETLSANSFMLFETSNARNGFMEPYNGLMKLDRRERKAKKMSQNVEWSRSVQAFWESRRFFRGRLKHD